MVYNNQKPPLVNVGWGRDSTIRELADVIKDTVGIDAEIVYDRSKPDGTPRKLLDIELMRSLGWVATTSLRDGLKLTYASFKEANHEMTRRPERRQARF
jgi:GDP-L-fucose synthase